MSFGSQAWAARNVQGLQAQLTAWYVLKTMLAGLLMLGLGLAFGWALFQTTKGTAIFVIGCLFAVPFGLAVMAATCYQYMGEEPALVLDRDGLRSRLSGRVTWPDVLGIRVDEAYAGKGRKAPVLSLGLVPGARAQGGLSNWLGLAPKPWMRVALRGLDRPPGEIEAAAKALRAHVRPSILEGWNVEMGQELVAALWKSQLVGQAMEELMARAPNPNAAQLAEMERLMRENSAGMAEILRLGTLDQQRLLGKLRGLNAWIWGLTLVVALLFLLRLAMKH